MQAEHTGVAARYEAQEAQLQLRCREQEEALRREIERAARLQSQLRQAQEAHAAAEQRAEAAAAAAGAGGAAGEGAQRQLQLRVGRRLARLLASLAKNQVPKSMHV